MCVPFIPIRPIDIFKHIFLRNHHGRPIELKFKKIYGPGYDKRYLMIILIKIYLRVAVKLNFRPYIRRYTSPNENFEYSYPLILWVFLC